jgi:hypothetical protein
MHTLYRIRDFIGDISAIVFVLTAIQKVWRFGKRFYLYMAGTAFGVAVVAIVANTGHFAWRLAPELRAVLSVMVGVMAGIVSELRAVLSVMVTDMAGFLAAVGQIIGREFLPAFQSSLVLTLTTAAAAILSIGVALRTIAVQAVQAFRQLHR